jgi:hypothetical protein
MITALAGLAAYVLLVTWTCRRLEEVSAELRRPD